MKSDLDDSELLLEIFIYITMHPAKVFIISAVTEQYEAVNIILRHLAARGNDVTLFGKPFSYLHLLLFADI